VIVNRIKPPSSVKPAVIRILQFLPGALGKVITELRRRKEVFQHLVDRVKIDGVTSHRYIPAKAVEEALLLRHTGE
jgi:hypothetical protein